MRSTGNVQSLAMRLGRGFARDREDRVTETREVDHPDKEEGDLLSLTLSSLDYPLWI